MNKYIKSVFEWVGCIMTIAVGVVVVHDLWFHVPTGSLIYFALGSLVFDVVGCLYIRYYGRVE